MVDEAGGEPPPPTPPPTSSVVSLVEVSKAKAAQTAAAAPEPSAGANAPDKGAGGGKPKKPDKTIDWGLYSHVLENFALIYGTDTVWDGGQRMIMKLANMAHAHGSDIVKMWKGSPARRTVLPQDVVFDPTGQADTVRCINLFDGIALEPVKGDVKPMLELVRYLTSRASDSQDESDEIMHWLLQWLAYPLQHVGAKMRTAIVMHGPEGAGKNFLFDAVAAIYGKYGCLVGQDELEDKFNDWRSCKLFVVGDEVSTRQEMAHTKNRLKALVTSDTVQINPKNLPRREESNHMNVVFLSNEITPLQLDNTDRRYLVIYTPKPKDFSFYRALGKWRESGGIAAFYEYLLSYPLDGFDPFAPAPQTAAKKDLIHIGRKSPELFWLEWSQGEIDLPYWPCATTQVYRAYLKWCQRTGERFPARQGVFTPAMRGISESENRPIRTKPMKPKNELGVKKTEHMLLTVDPPDKDQGVWASDCREAFEKELRKYLGSGFPHSPNGSANGDDE